MNHRKALISLILLLSVCSLVTVDFSQAPSAAPASAAEPMGENDRLPFMQSEENPASPEPSSSGLLLKTIGAMLLVVGLIFAGAWAAKKMGFGGGGKGAPDELGLSVLSSVSMGNGRTISTVRFGDRTLLVGLTAQAFTLLAEEKTGEGTGQIKSRSVAEMLAEEDSSFSYEFDNARSKFRRWDQDEEAA